MTFKVGIIGVGNMGEALLAGLVHSGFNPSDICIAVKREERGVELNKKYGVEVVSASIAAGSEVVLLGVKPKDILDLTSSIKSSLKPGSLVISVAAGKTISSFETILGLHAIARVMPNTPTMLGKGMAGISYNSQVSLQQKEVVRSLFASSGKWVEVEESLQDAVTATSGSGPAYFFAFVEAMIEGGKKLGLSEEVASTLAIQTVVGAAEMLQNSGKSPSTLRENVTSPNGTTFAALTNFAEGGLSDLVANSMAAAAKRSKELA